MSSLSNPRLLSSLARIWENDSFGSLIQPHWLHYEQASETFHVLSGLLILLIALAAVFGNGFVIYVSLTTKSLRSKSNALVVNLAVSDLLMITVLAPMYAISSFQLHWVFGYYGCQFYGFVGSLCGTAAIITITAMALDRCSVIRKPYVRLKGAISTKRSFFTLSFIWTFSFIWAAIPLFPGFAPYVPEGFLTTCSFNILDNSDLNRLYIGAMCIAVYFIPLLVIIIAYARILSVVMVRRTVVESLYGGRGRMSVTIGQKRRKQQMKSAKISFFVVVGWALAWTPFTIVSLLGIFGAYSYLTPAACHFPAIFAKTASVYNPIIYAFNSPTYRLAFKRTITNLLTYESVQRRLIKSGHRSITTLGRPTLSPERMPSLPNIRRRLPLGVRRSTCPRLVTQPMTRKYTL